MKDNHALTPRHHKNLQEGEKKIQKYIFSLQKVIGKGSYATVYKGRRITDDLPTAVKVIDKKIFVNTYNIKSIQSQIDIMKKVDHPNIVKLLDVYQTSNNMYIVTEFCQNGDLRNYLRKKRKIPERQAKRILGDLMNGFKYLNSLDIIHRDLKPANILINNGVCKISDFGFAKNLQFGEDTVMKSIVGTPLYMSPQILNKNQYTNKSDLWSVGLIFYQIIYGQTPWPASNQIQLLSGIMTKTVPFDYNISEKSKDFIRKCLKIKQEDRMTWEQAFNHPILQQIQEEKHYRNQQIALKRLDQQNRAESNHTKSKSTKKRKQRSKTPTKLNVTATKPHTPRRRQNITPQRSPWRL